MANIYVNKIQVGESTKTVVTINHTQEDQQQTVETKTVDAVHHIHVLDRSGSMSGLIGQLVEEVKLTLDHISDEDYVSIVWFSGEKECRTLFKGSKKDKALYAKLDTLKSTVGLTCFSTPMKEVNEIIEDLYDTCPNLSITVFTDGQPVVSWSDAEEERLIFAEIAKMKDKVLALNTIGYGYYYNQDLLRRMAQETVFGTAIHSNKINEYLTIFDHNYEKVADLVAETVEIAAPVGSDIIYLNTSSTKLEKNTGFLKMNRLEKRKNQFFIVGEGDFDFQYNGETYNTNNINDEAQQATVLNFYYAYAYELHYLGYRQDALAIMSHNIKDKYFIDRQLNAFTYDEVAVLRKELKKAVVKPKDNRYRDGQAPDGYLPKEDALCVMDVLNILSEGTNYYVPSKNYNRIGQAVVDNQNMFKANDEEVKSLFSDFVFNKEKLNVSILFNIQGKTKINAKTAARVGLDKEIESKIFRTHTIIKDGNLNMETIEAILDQKTYDKILKLEADNEISVMTLNAQEGESYRVIIDLTKLTVINKTYVTDAGNIDNVLDSTYKMTELEAKQKVVNSFIKEVKANNVAALKEGGFANLTEEQIEVLKEHGLSKDLVYGGVDNEKQDPTDFYIARELSFQIKGMASIPAVNKVIDDSQDAKKAAKIKGVAKIMLDYITDLDGRMKAAGLAGYNDHSVEGKEFLDKELKSIKKELFSERVKMNSMKIAKVLTGDWFTGTEIDDKGVETYTRGDIVLVIKRNKVEVPV